MKNIHLPKKKVADIDRINAIMLETTLEANKKHGIKSDPELIKAVEKLKKAKEGLQ